MPACDPFGVLLGTAEMGRLHYRVLTCWRHLPDPVLDTADLAHRHTSEGQRNEGKSFSGAVPKSVLRGQIRQCGAAGERCSKKD